MKSFYAWLVAILFLLNQPLHGQDVPLFTQKLTNSFLYNPSVAGNSLGSMTFSHRQNWTGVQGAPSINYFSIHTPFAGDRFGTGLNIYQEQAGIYQTFSAIAAFAYHIKMTETRSFSMGVSGEYSSFRIDRSKIDVIDLSDAQINGATSGQYDFSFGMTYKSKYLSFGLAANRLKSLVQGIDNTALKFPAFYSMNLAGRFPIRDKKDLLEPIITYRSFISGKNQIDAGVFYTINKAVILGGAYRTGGTVSTTLGFKFLNKYLIGYTRDLYVAGYGSSLGSSNEITLRFDFKSQEYYSNYKNLRNINLQALAVRRKTIGSFSHGKPSHKATQQSKRIIRRNYQKSPNYRLSTSKKLNTISTKRRR